MTIAIFTERSLRSQDGRTTASAQVACSVHARGANDPIRLQLQGAPFEGTHRAQRTPGCGLSSQHAKLRPVRTSTLRRGCTRIAGCLPRAVRGRGITRSQRTGGNPNPASGLAEDLIPGHRPVERPLATGFYNGMCGSSTLGSRASGRLFLP